MSDASPCLQRWEYASLCRQTDKNLVAVLNKVGVLGWEAISASFNKDLKGIWAWTAFLKRPLAPGAVPTDNINDVLDGVAPEGQETKDVLARFELPEGDFELKD
jgi:hypothetical protein